MTNTELVTRAALWLDTIKNGWAQQIDLDSLLMINGNVCISGQLFGQGTWVETARSMSEDTGIPTATPEARGTENVFSNYDDEWKVQVRARLPIRSTREDIAAAIKNGETEGIGWKLEIS